MSQYIVAEAGVESDAAAVCSLWTRNLESGCPAQAKNKLQQGYVANPAASGFLFTVHEQDDPSPAGVIGLHPRRFFLGAQEWLAATLADFAVDNAHRSAGPALMLMRTALSAGRDRFTLIIGIPNKQSYAVCRRAGMASLGTLTNYTLVISSRQRLAQRIQHRWLPVAAPIVDLALACRLLWKNLSVRPVLRCREASLYDDSLDRIWAQRSSSLLLSDRSASMLRWRYCRAQPRHWRVSIMQTLDGDDCGYVIWRLEDKLAVIGDFFSIDPARLTASILSAHARAIKAEGAHSISTSFLGIESVSSAFLKAGYFVAESQGDRVLVAGNESLDEVTLSQYYLTCYDNDD